MIMRVVIGLQLISSCLSDPVCDCGSRRHVVCLADGVSSVVCSVEDNDSNWIGGNERADTSSCSTCNALLIESTTIVKIIRNC